MKKQKKRGGVRKQGIEKSLDDKVKSSRRSRNKYPALDPNLNLKIRYEEIDDVSSYKDQLNEEEKIWMNKFMEEYVNAKVDTKRLKRNLHNTEALKKNCFDRNNARNRDILSRAKAQMTLEFTEDMYQDPDGFNVQFDELELFQDTNGEITPTLFSKDLDEGEDD